MSVTPSNSNDYLAQAIGLATRNVGEAGGPFGAVVVLADGTVAYGVNRVTANNDPTAHAEVSAIRAAGMIAGTNDLTGATLYTSCQPCPMCLAASMWARIDTVIYAASDMDAASVGFDDREFYDEFARIPRGGLVSLKTLVVREDSREDRMAPFEAWAANEARTDY